MTGLGCERNDDVGSGMFSWRCLRDTQGRTSVGGLMSDLEVRSKLNGGEEWESLCN